MQKDLPPYDPCPCTKDCAERHVGCHGDCTKGYVEWHQRRLKKYDERSMSRVYNDAKSDVIQKFERHNRRR